MKKHLPPIACTLLVALNVVFLAARSAIAGPEKASSDMTRMGVARTQITNDMAIVTTPDEAPRAWADKLWGKELPTGLSVSCDVIKLHEAIAGADYLVEFLAPPLGKGSDDLTGLRAVVIPDQTPLSKEDCDRLRQYVKNGGKLIAFGHASLLDQKGEIRGDYLLTGVFGVRFGGRVGFPVEARPAMSSDSIFARIYGPEKVIDAKRDFWASADKPMPHWVQMDFPRPKEIARVDVLSRDGGYLLYDFDVQISKKKKWVTVKSVRKNNAKKAACALDEPVKTSSLRLLVLKELINGKDRQIADVGEIEPYDAAGRKIISQPYKIVARISDAALAKAYKSSRMKIRSPALKLRLAGARALALFADPQDGGGELPLCTANDFGKGKAYLFAVPEAIFANDNDFWFTLLRLFVGEPTLRHSGDKNLRAYLTQGKGGRVLYLMDQNPESKRKGKTKKVIVRINCGILGDISSATILPNRASVDLKKRGEWVQFVVPIEPVTMVELK